MAEIYCVRHGQAAADWQENTDPGLSEQGMQQAHEVALTLAQFNIKRIVSSPMQRALDTADPLSRLLGLDVEVAEAFREIPTPPAVPIFERLQWLRSCAQSQWQQMDDSLLQWRDRIIQELKQIETPAVVFTHFMVLNAIVSQIRNHSRLVNYQPDYCSILQIDRKGNQLVLTDLGSQAQSRIL